MSASTVKAGKTVSLMSRVVDQYDAPLDPDHVESASYTIYEMDATDLSDRTTVEGHTAVSLTPADVLFDDLQTDPAWSEDDQGYNFRILPENSPTPFATANASYLVVVTLVHDTLGVVTLEFPVNTLPEVSSSVYCNRQAIEMVFGADNVRKWSDLDNDRDQDKIQVRILWACQQATEQIDATLRGSNYEVPFTTIPAMIRQAAAWMAGSMLYDARGTQDTDQQTGEPVNLIAPFRRRAEKTLSDILSGKLELESGEDSDVVSTPKAVDTGGHHGHRFHHRYPRGFYVD